MSGRLFKELHQNSKVLRQSPRWTSWNHIEGGSKPSSMDRSAILSTSHRSSAPNQLFSGPNRTKNRDNLVKYTRCVDFRDAYCNVLRTKIPETKHPLDITEWHRFYFHHRCHRTGCFVPRTLCPRTFCLKAFSLGMFCFKTFCLRT